MLLCACLVFTKKGLALQDSFGRDSTRKLSPSAQMSAWKSILKFAATVSSIRFDYIFPRSCYCTLHDVDLTDTDAADNQLFMYFLAFSFCQRHVRCPHLPFFAAVSRTSPSWFIKLGQHGWQLSHNLSQVSLLEFSWTTSCFQLFLDSSFHLRLCSISLASNNQPVPDFGECITFLCFATRPFQRNSPLCAFGLKPEGTNFNHLPGRMIIF